MYEAMVYWETFDAAEDQPAWLRDFAGTWRAATKVVYSRNVGSAVQRQNADRTSLRPGSGATDEGGSWTGPLRRPDLASQAMAASLVDEINLSVTPLTVGGGTPALLAHFRSDLELVDVDRFKGGVVHLQYRISS
jgi:hypothetical protein